LSAFASAKAHPFAERKATDAPKALDSTAYPFFYRASYLMMNQGDDISEVNRLYEVHEVAEAL
jgi:hypothetical protein